MSKKATAITCGVWFVLMLLAPLCCIGLPVAPPVDLQQSVLLLEMFDEADESLGHGSCFVVAEKDGYWYAITAKHCVEETDYAEVFIRDVPVLKIGGVVVELMRKDPDVDVALVRFRSDAEYVILPLAEPVVKEPCVTVGWAGGTFLQFKGHVAGFDFKAGDEKYTVTNTGLYPGCSGGALLNANGEVIGVTVAVAAYRGIWDTVGLYVPIRFVRSMLETL